MPEKDGSEDKKSTKSVVNKKQKQFMNQEEQLDLSSVAESFGGQIVGEPEILNEMPAILAVPAIGAGILATGAVAYDSYQKLRGKKGILPVGVRQGSLGDCWLLAACSALAEKPERVRRVFGNKDYPKSGIF